jgi:hypothetical protein
MNIVALVFLSLLALAKSASAECAWVWWQEEEIWMPPRPLSKEWATPIAYPTRAACEARLTAYVRAWEESHNPGQSVMRDPSGTAAEFRTEVKGGGRTSVRRYCLPDTVDPRGPKGKWRG